MAKLYNLARMTTATTGTGTITLGSAVPSYLSFTASGVLDGETVTYAIADGNNREVGRGVYTSSGTTLTRTVLESTNSNNPINLSGNAEVFITAAAEDIANVNETNTFTAPQVINVGSSDTALRVTQTGSGTAIRVEDSSNPDTSPFIVTAEGRVGIGEDIPSFYLQVAAPNASTQTQMGLTSTNYTSDFKSVYLQYSDASTSGTTFGISNAGLGAVLFQNNSNALIGTNGSAPIIFGTTATERMRITGAGNVGIGLTNPSVQLQVVGSAAQNRLWLGSAATTNRQLFVRSNGTLAVPTIVASGDAVGSTNFFGYDGAANIELASMVATVDGTPGTNDMPGRLTFSTTADGASSPTERLRISNGGNVLVTGSGGLGYGTGSGGTVTQATSKETAVTLNKPAGQITMNNAALAAGASVSFTLNNSVLAAPDTLIVSHSTTGGTSGAYLVEVLTIGAGTAVIRVTNITGGSLSEAAVLNFAVIKGATA